MRARRVASPANCLYNLALDAGSRTVGQVQLCREGCAAQLEAREIPAAHGHLEGLLRLPDAVADPPAMAAVVCHPHPQFGGSMHTKTVFRIAQALVDLGVPTLRFNFRGVGRSTGVYDEGRGERDDVRFALDALAGRFPGVPLCLGGFSFGSWVGLPVGCGDERVRQLLGVGVPVRLLTTSALEGCAPPVKPKLVVQGQYDEYGPLESLLPWFERLPPPRQLEIIPGADHFFTHQQTALHDAIVGYFRSSAAALGRA
jgi:alpha/beta superfamily hydrolase